MRTEIRFGAALLSAALAMPAVMRAADKPAEAPEKADQQKEMESRLKALEQRVRDLEAQLAERDDFRQQQQPRGNNRMNQFREKMRDGFDDLMDRLQREMDGFGGRFGGGGNPFGGPGFGGPNDFNDPRQMFGNKPRLGVELEGSTPELRERFKNDVQDGAFVRSVVPGSPAEKAGLNVGDAITSFGGKAIKDPQDLIEAVRSAPKGKHEMAVHRHGEPLMLKVDLSSAPEEAEETAGGWMRRGDPQAKGGAPGGVQSRTEVKTSALELSDNLAKDMKLNDEQKKKVRDVLDKHAKELADEASAGAAKRSRRGGMSFNLRGDISGLAEKHADAAAKDLAGILNPDQLKQWNDYRKTHNSVSISQSTVIENTGIDNDRDEGTRF